MIKAVLLDLDNTLLDNPDHKFAVAFRRALAKHLEEQTGRAAADGAFRNAARKLNEQRHIVSSNDEVMTACMAAELGASINDTGKLLTHFYESSYGRLRRHTTAMPDTQKLLEALFDQRLTVAIATNPIYPESAIIQRLQWAGLSKFIESFAYVTCSENMHFAKPDPAFYAELVARMGIEPDEALMVGDNAVNDIRPAETVGLHTWQVENAAALTAFVEHVQLDGWQHCYSARPLQETMLKPQFLGNLGALFGMLREVKDHQWHQKPDPDEWSIVQILCHLAETETSVHRSRLRTILEIDNPFIRALPAPGPDVPPCNASGYDVADEFREKRLSTLELIAELAPADWKRPARHSIFGLTNLLEMAYFTAQHDRLHISQLCQTLGKCLDPL